MLDPGTDHVCFVLEPIDTVWDPSSGQLGLHDVLGLEPGHDAHERQTP
jgi:hypothetical protein